MQIVAKRLLIFGMHVHIGIKDRELRIDIMNQLRYFMPHNFNAVNVFTILVGTENRF